MLEHGHKTHVDSSVGIAAITVFSIAVLLLIYLNFRFPENEEEQIPLTSYIETVKVERKEDSDEKAVRKTFKDKRNLFLTLTSFHPRDITPIMEAEEEDELDSIDVNEHRRTHDKKHKTKTNLGYVSCVYDMTGEFIVRTEFRNNLPFIAQKEVTIRECEEDSDSSREFPDIELPDESYYLAKR